MNFLRNTINKHFVEEPFYYDQVESTNEFVSRSNSTSNALNVYKNASSPVKVVHWFDNFWIYSKITKAWPELVAIQSFTLSVFYGNTDDSEKNHLFRAEWDINDNTDAHPQPHWHFYPKLEVRKYKKSFAEFIKKDERVSFLADISDEITHDTIELKRFHFAMNGQWVKGNGHKHNILNKNDFKNWIDGLLAHLKTQLRYVRGLD